MSALDGILLRIRQDALLQSTLDAPKPLFLQAGTTYVFTVAVERLDPAFLPPLHKPLDVTGLTGRLLLKTDVDDEEPFLSVALPVINGPGGLLAETIAIPLSDNLPDFPVNQGYGEIVILDAGNPVLRVPFTIVVQPEGVAV